MMSNCLVKSVLLSRQKKLNLLRCSHSIKVKSKNFFWWNKSFSLSNWISRETRMSSKSLLLLSYFFESLNWKSKFESFFYALYYKIFLFWILKSYSMCIINRKMTLQIMSSMNSFLTNACLIFPVSFLFLH